MANGDIDALMADIKKLPPRAAAILALRAAMRLLPALAIRHDGQRSAFAWWKSTERSHHTLSILRGYQSSIFSNSLAKIDDYARAAYTRAAVNARNAYASASEAHAANAANAAAAAYAAAVAAYTANATLNATYAAANATAAATVNAAAALAAVESDISAIIRPRADTQTLLTAPLWPEGVPPQIDELWRSLQVDLRGLEAGFDIWIDWYEARLRGEPLDLDVEAKWALLSNSRLAQSPAEINAYLKSLLKGEATEPLNRVRAIFIGDGGVGKTSLVRALCGETIVPGDGEMTPGVVMQDATLDEKAGVFTKEQCLDGDGGLTVHLWDFGGQVMAHATHQFFLREQCLYVVVLDGRKVRNANEEAEYWLEHVRAFGKGAPVMLVGNKSDLAPVDLDLALLKRKHPNVIDFYPLSCTEARDRFRAEFERFQRDFKERLAKLGIHAERFTKAQFDVLSTVREKAATGNFLSHTDFGKICKEFSIADSGPGGRASLLDLFDKLGVVMHFPELKFLKHVVLNPRWLTYGVYQVLYSEKAQAEKGRIEEGDVAEILDGLSLKQPDGRAIRFPARHLRLIVDAMVAFHVAYRVSRDQPSLVIPALLPAQEPPFSFATSNAIAFQFDFKGFLPRHVLPALIVDHHGDIARDDDTGADIVWQNGVLLRPTGRHDAEALITADYHERNLDIHVRGRDANAYLGVIRDAIRRTLDKMPDLPYDEKLRLRPDMRIPGTGQSLEERPAWIDYKAVLVALRNGWKQIPAADGIYDLEKVLALMPPPLKHEQAGICIAVNGSGSPVISVNQNSAGSSQHTRAGFVEGEEASLPPTSQRRIRKQAMPESFCLPPISEDEEAVLKQLPEGPREALRGVLDDFKGWPVGQPIEVSFMGGSQELRAFFVETAQEWVEAAKGSIAFDFGAAPGYRDHRPLRPAQIRVAFEPKGNWSYIGIDSAGAGPLKQGASLNIGDAAGKDFKLLRREALRAVILHELGHALGLQHEHQSPEAACEKEFDWEKVYASLGSPPNGWSKAEVDHNLRPLLRMPRRRVTPYDPKSIMHYALPVELFRNGVKSKCFIERNTALSDGDRQIIQAAYPATPEKQQAYLAEAGKRIAGVLEQSGISQSEAKALADLAAELVKQSHPEMAFKIDITNVRKDVRKQEIFKQSVKGDNNIVVGQTKNGNVTINRK